MRQQVFALVLLAGMLGGCGSRAMMQDSDLDYTMGHPLEDASIKLTEIADSVNTSLKELARIEAAAATTPSYGSLPQPDLPDLEGLASIEWTGPIGPIIEKIAHDSGYQLRTLGHPPAVPVIVSISATDVPLSTILRDIDFQAQANQKAHIVVYPNPDPSKRTIELRYAKS